ncbi:nuclear transport factor 2 family protein [Paenibacillus sp. alder61]|uniref:YybH family protein n=1 Tax=Paenibacillus sp. alder61 TaxID=2862948 RepID=UPI001CD5260C|nr:DUF4440 domain-containing protein [Paenibacillus sp. alder61]MCA1295985.1 nuclear transport factor 2 family protein [Paenibacillus sp. alder61]
MDYKEALKRYIEMTNTHHFDNVQPLLHPEAVYWFSDKTCRTMEEIRAYFENSWNLIKDEVYNASEIQWLAADEKVATCIYTYQYEGYYNGEYVKGSGRATNIFVKENDGDWRLIHEHLSRDPA